jgi:hypothetical protein
MNDTECQATFPGVFAEIDRAASYCQNKGLSRITSEDLDLAWKDSGAVGAQIVDGSLFVLEHKFNGDGYHINRALTTLAAIHRCLVTASVPIPDVQFAFAVSDVADESQTIQNLWGGHGVEICESGTDIFNTCEEPDTAGKVRINRCADHAAARRYRGGAPKQPIRAPSFDFKSARRL